MNLQENYSKYKLQYPLDSLKAAELREQSFQSFLKEGWPSKKDEAWKFTSLSSLKDTNWSPSFEDVYLNHDQLKFISKHLNSEFYNIVLVNGLVNETLSDSDFQFFSKTEFDKEDYTLATDHGSDHPDRKLIVLADAFTHAKYKLVIPQKYKMSKPIQIVEVVTGISDLMAQTRLHVTLGADAQAEIIHNNLKLDGQKNKTLLQVDFKVDVGSGANLKWISLDQRSDLDYTFIRHSFAVQNSAQLTVLDLALGSALSRHYVDIHLKSENASAGLFGLSLLKSQQHADHYTFINHEKGHNTTTQHYKTILSDEAHAVFRGRVRIEKDAQKAQSEQLNNNLLLSSKAFADSVPQLEIYADDVKAGHGSTVGRLNQEEIFYFLSRGMNEKTAIEMLSHGYAKELVYKIDNDLIQNVLFQAIEEKLKAL